MFILLSAQIELKERINFVLIYTVPCCTYISQAMVEGLAQKRSLRIETVRFTLRYADVSRSGRIAPWSFQEFFMSACAASKSMRVLCRGGLVYPQIYHSVSMLVPSDDDKPDAARITDFEVNCGFEITGAMGSTLYTRASFEVLDATRPEWRCALGELVAVAVCVNQDNFERTNVPIDRIYSNVSANTAASPTAPPPRLTWPPTKPDQGIEEITRFTIQPWHEDALQHVTNHMHGRFLWDALQTALPDTTPGATVNFSIQFRKQAHAGQRVSVVLAACTDKPSAALMRGQTAVCIAQASVQHLSPRSAL